MKSKDLIIDKQVFKPGENGIVKLNVGKLPSDTRINVQAHVFRGKNSGPTTLVLAGVHGDEINGIEIARRLLKSSKLDKIKAGTVIVIPLLNIYGFINFNRYVPDGKDVNRSFPGTKSGSLASRIARTLTKTILPLVDYIFDFHTGGDSRYNFPQIRISKKDMKIPILIYEAGESTRLNARAIDVGYKGLLNCLVHLGYLSEADSFTMARRRFLIKKTTWIRASFSGIFLWSQGSGAMVYKGEKLGTINDPNGQKSISVVTKINGILIGHNNASVVNQGDALFHLGYDYEEIL